MKKSSPYLLTEIERIDRNWNRIEIEKKLLAVLTKPISNMQKKLYGPFLSMGFNCLKAGASSRRQFIWSSQKFWYRLFQKYMWRTYTGLSNKISDRVCKKNIFLNKPCVYTMTYICLKTVILFLYLSSYFSYCNPFKVLLFQLLASLLLKQFFNKWVYLLQIDLLYHLYSCRIYLEYFQVQ